MPNTTSTPEQMVAAHLGFEGQSLEVITAYVAQVTARLLNEAVEDVRQRRASDCGTAWPTVPEGGAAVEADCLNRNLHSIILHATDPYGT
jgi:hypothetical protein